MTECVNCYNRCVSASYSTAMPRILPINPGRTYVSEAVPVLELAAVLWNGGQPLLVIHEIARLLCRLHALRLGLLEGEAAEHQHQQRGQEATHIRNSQHVSGHLRHAHRLSASGRRLEKEEEEEEVDDAEAGITPLTESLQEEDDAPSAAAARSRRRRRCGERAREGDERKESEREWKAVPNLKSYCAVGAPHLFPWQKSKSAVHKKTKHYCWVFVAFTKKKEKYKDCWWLSKILVSSHNLFLLLFYFLILTRSRFTQEDSTPSLGLFVGKVLFVLNASPILIQTHTVKSNANHGHIAFKWYEYAPNKTLQMKSAAFQVVYITFLEEMLVTKRARFKYWIIFCCNHMCM